MNRGQKELEDLQAVIGGVSTFVLRAAYDPEAAFFCVFERVEMTFNAFKPSGAEDNFDTVGGLAFAAMYNGGAQTLAEGQITIVQDGVDVIVHSSE